MKGKVFIGWTSNTEIACKVRDMLPEYVCFIGGDDPENRTNEASYDSYVGETVINQLNNCNQAIFIIGKKENIISSNVIFELGYACSKFKSVMRKIHVFYLDIPQKDDAIPTDIIGMWAEHMNTEGMSEDDIASHIVAHFLKRQLNAITENKMKIVNSWYKIENALANHATDPQYSDFELAQYLLFYIHSAYIFDFVDSAEIQIRNLSAHDNMESQELRIAIKIGLMATHIMKCAAGNTIMTEDLYDDIYEKYLSIKRKIESCTENTSEFIMWANTMCNDYLNLACICRLLEYSKSEDADEDMMNEFYETIITTSTMVLNLCESLRKYNPVCNSEFATLLEAYIYRNLALVHNLKKDEENERKYLELSYDKRRHLYEVYENKHVDTRLMDNFAMEYHLIMSEMLKFETTGPRARRFKKKVSSYIEKCQNNSNLISQYIEKMKTLIT